MRSYLSNQQGSALLIFAFLLALITLLGVFVSNYTSVSTREARLLRVTQDIANLRTWVATNTDCGATLSNPICTSGQPYLNVIRQGDAAIMIPAPADATASSALQVGDFRIRASCVACSSGCTYKLYIEILRTNGPDAMWQKTGVWTDLFFDPRQTLTPACTI